MKAGDGVIDQEGNTGTIEEVIDIHNIKVRYDDGLGVGLYCLDRKCENYDPLQLKGN